jgi:transglutaminase-like putative cysteine protease
MACTVVATVNAAALPLIREDINEGRWQRASSSIRQALAEDGLSAADRNALLFERDRMRRIRLDFNQTRAQVLRNAQQIVPDVTESLFAKWEAAGAVEYLEIDGERHYFERAAGNLFRIHPEAKALKLARYPARTGLEGTQRGMVQQILTEVKAKGRAIVLRKRFRVLYELTVSPGAVPQGEIIRAWLPYPHRNCHQSDIRLIASDPPIHILSPPAHPLSSMYLEKPSRGSEPTRFRVTFEYSSTAYHQPIRAPEIQKPALTRHEQPEAHLGERPPHIVFDKSLRRLSSEIVGDETQSTLIAQRIFRWVSENVPWAGAREYSTLHSLTDYALKRHHGDCGIQTMLFMSLCRLNGIPARWESGWITGPQPNLHDWCAIYLKPYGWLPVDVSYGMQPSDDERTRWFYLGGIDSHRLVVNADYAQPLYPAKTFYRSEIVDFQRGEVEWRGGNLYFDQWTYDFHVDELPSESVRASTTRSLFQFGHP